jgi:hypothetical protein
MILPKKKKKKLFAADSMHVTNMTCTWLAFFRAQRNMNWLINRKSQLSLENKITIYNAIIKPVCTYGIELWGWSKPSNTKILQTFQSKTLRKVANAPWYISNVA